VSRPGDARPLRAPTPRRGLRVRLLFVQLRLAVVEHRSARDRVAEDPASVDFDSLILRVAGYDAQPR
jgi:hypothetical protein